MKLFVFDFDGTLSNSTAFICKTMQAAFSAHNFPIPTHHEVRRIIGITLDEAIYEINQTLTPENINKISDTYKSIYKETRQNGLIQDELFNGALEILDTLQQANHTMAIATGKSLAGLDAELDRYQIRKYFSGYETSDTHPSKPHPAMLESLINQLNIPPEQTFMIGDTSYDMMMAKSAHTCAIGVSWGCHDTETLLKSGADHIIENFSALKKFI